MTGISLQYAQEQLQKWLELEAKLSEKKNHNYSHGSDTESFSSSDKDLDAVTEKIKFWDRRVQQLSRGGKVTVKTIVPSC